MTDIPIVLTAAGRQSTPPATLNADLIAAVAAINPGYTADLPGALIEDIASTDTGSLVTIDGAVTEVINSITPYGANAFLLVQQGQLFGIPVGSTVNTSVYVVFSGAPGFIIGVGFTVSDGTYQYVVQDGGVIATSGTSAQIYCVATQQGSWAVPAGTVTTLITSVPSSISLTVTNPNTGTPAVTGQTEEAYRAQVLQGYQAPAQGFPGTLRRLLGNVSGVQARLVSIIQNAGTWEILVGGGDPYEVANAIFLALFDISTLVGSATTVRNITVSLNDYPNTYSVVFVNPPQQTVQIALTWNTSSPNFVSATAVTTAAAPALAAYVNSIYVGQPMNLYELQSTFRQAVGPLLETPATVGSGASLITKMAFTVSINGTVVPPESGTGIIAGDPESYFLTTSTQISINQG